MCQEWIRVEPIKLAEKLRERRQNNLGGNLGLGQIKTYFMQRSKKLSKNEFLSVLKYYRNDNSPKSP